MDDAEYVIAAYGTTARIALTAIRQARAQGVKAGLIRPITLWPFPSEAFARAAQRLLDGHRLAALAAGNVPQRGMDACAAPLTPAALAAAFASPEPLDPQGPELLRRVAALPVCPPPRLTQTQQMCLAQAIVWRHGMDALDDRDVIFPVRYAAAALRLLDCLAAVSGRTDAQLVVCVMRETENDPEALPRLCAGLQNTAKL